MKVELVALTQPYNKAVNGIQNPMCAVEEAASVCYDSEPTENFKIAKGCAKTGHCYDGDTEVLTSNGFVKWKYISGSDLIGAVDPATGDFLGFEKPIALIKRQYDGDMIRIEHRYASLLVTDSHNLYASVSKTAKDRTNPCFSLIPANQQLKTGKKLYESPFRLKTYATNPNNNVSRYDEIYALFGFFIGDGYASPNCTDKSHKIRFKLKKERKINFLKRTCENLGFDFNEMKSNNFSVNLKGYTQKWFRDSFYNRSGEKTFPNEFYGMSKNQFQFFVSGLMESDGYYCGISKNTQYSTTSKELADKIQTICSINGVSCKVTKSNCNEYAAYTVYMFRNGRKSFPMINDSRMPNSKASTEKFSGLVYCAQVSSGLLIVRRNGVVCLCGNCSVYEHISFTFHVTGVSRALLAQLTRHRHASYSVRSQRYCNEDNFEYYIPKSCNSNTFYDAMHESQGYYSELVESGVSKEDARMVLPNACCTELYITMNARALIESSHLRLCNRAQTEIRSMFMHMRDEVFSVCPEVAELMVPSCEINPEYPFCTEAKSCGRHPKLSEVYHAE